MIGAVLARLATILPLILALKEVHDFATREIKPNHIYTTREVARYLGLERREVIRLLREKKLRGKLVEGNYRILGKSILEYLER